MLSTVARNSGLLVISLILAIFLLSLTTDITVYQSANNVQELGVTTWSGLPVPYKASAAGTQWIEYDWWRMSASVLIWLLCIFFGLRSLEKTMSQSINEHSVRK